MHYCLPPPPGQAVLPGGQHQQLAPGDVVAGNVSAGAVLVDSVRASEVVVRGSSADQMSLDVSGRAYVDDLTVERFVQLSDARLKVAIEPAANDALAALRSMRAVTYCLRSDGEGGKRKLGLLAQEVQRALPDCVTVRTCACVRVFTCALMCVCVCVFVFVPVCAKERGVVEEDKPACVVWARVHASLPVGQLSDLRSRTCHAQHMYTRPARRREALAAANCWASTSMR